MRGPDDGGDAMHRRIALLALLTLPSAALAQTAPPDTELHLGESAEVTRAPDEVVAVLRAEARAGSAAAAQEAVNRSVTAAVARARGVAGVRVATGGYWTGRVDDNRAWVASQQVTLRSGEGAPLLELVGALQGQGLAMSQLSWTLTRETQRAAREEASRLALDALRRRAEAVAQQLGLQVAGLKEVRIDVPERMPRPMAAPMAAASRSSAAPPPVAIAEDIVVAATVQAVVVLRPR
jgi:predicted secreted protein